ncbi:MAG TPA: TetR/AcrR family transcriptional regulator [Rhodobacteraceae bacterium]|nr:TetR/AcrR family transcriptional regulator [Paracoccaceae bacterium]
MSGRLTKEKQRQRAPSKRSLETRARILDAAERVFAQRGFEGASLRDIAAEAGVQVALVSHHGGHKEALFARIIQRRAEPLASLRLEALAARRAQGPLDARAVLRCFVEPYIARAETGGPQWLAYARLVAMVSAEPRWRALAAECFDPTARTFIDVLAGLYPGAPRAAVATGFVYTVAAMLAEITSAWRIGALAGTDRPGGAALEAVLRFCAAGLDATLSGPRGNASAT